MKKVFGILLVGLLSMSLEAHSKDVSRKVTKPVGLEQNVSIKNNKNEYSRIKKSNRLKNKSISIYFSPK